MSYGGGFRAWPAPATPAKLRIPSLSRERQPALHARMEAVLADESPSTAELTSIAHAVRGTGALAATRELAEEHVRLALDALSVLPAGTARESLETVALASLERQS